MQREAAEARNTAAGVCIMNKAFDGAIRKGAEAYRRGDPVSTCPYQDKRKDCGRLTWSRAFRAAWLDGWYDARRDATGIVSRED